MAKRHTPLNLAEALSLLEEEIDKEEAVNVYLTPPVDVGAITDEDSDLSDEEGVVNPNHFGPQLLAAPCLVERQTLVENSEEEDAEEQPSTSASSSSGPKSKKRKLPLPTWRKGRKSTAQNVAYTEQTFTNTDNTSPLQLFRSFFDDEVIERILTQTNLYAQQKNIALGLTEAELMTFLGCLLLSGYSKLPQRRMYWYGEDDVPKLIANSIRRNRFEEILKCIHLADNTSLDTNDRAAKIRYFMTLLQERFRENNTLDKDLAIDESMIPYYGRHYAKQYIKGKPIRFGFKNWALCSSEGYMYAFDIYMGKSATTYDFGLGGSVVTGLLDQASVPPHSGHTVHFDNYFSSYELMRHLRNEGYNAVGTVRENRTGKCPVKSVQEMRKAKKGSYDYRSSGDILVIRWVDNSIVTLISNFGEVAEGQTSRWIQQEGKSTKTVITRPTLFSVYNEGMGGVDQIDQQVAAYRTRIRQRKWWWPIFVYLLDVTVANAWYLQRKMRPTDKKMSLLKFRRELAITLLRSYGVPSVQGKRPAPASTDVRFDGKNHWIVKGETERRCKLCQKKSKYRCEKCDVGLHADCFKDYHMK